MALADALKSPIVHALGGKEYVEYDNPFDVGMTGLIGFSSGYYAMEDCDTLLMLGTDFPYRQFYPEGRVRIAQIDIRPRTSAAVPRSIWVWSAMWRDDLGAPASPPRKNRTAHLDRAGALHEARKGLDELASGTPRGTPDPSAAGRPAVERTRGGRCGLHLRCRHAHRLGRSLSHYERQAPAARLLLSRLHGQRDAAGDRRAVGLPGRQVITLSGDGGFAMLMGDFLTLGQLGLPVKVVVFNNGALASSSSR